MERKEKMKKAVIGISTSIMVDREGDFAGYERIYVNRDYIQSVIAAGAVPLMLPLENSEDMIFLHSVIRRSLMPNLKKFARKEISLISLFIGW